MRLAVHLHLYYLEQLPQILAYLKNLAGVDYDLIVTMCGEDAAAESGLKTFKPDVQIIKVENRGYDVAPFMEFLHRIKLDDYDYILKLHTKNTTKGNYTQLNGRRFDNALWAKVLYDALLKSPQQVAKNLQMMAQNPQTGMISAAYCITNEYKFYDKWLDEINSCLAEMNLPQVRDFSFVAGTMFLARAEIFKPFLCYGIKDFEPTDGKIKEGTKAHIFERLFGAVVKASGFETYGVRQWRYGILLLRSAIIRFFYQKKITTSGKKLIKICKIPVYSKKTKNMGI